MILVYHTSIIVFNKILSISPDIVPNHIPDEHEESDSENQECNVVVRHACFSHGPSDILILTRVAPGFHMKFVESFRESSRMKVLLLDHRIGSIRSVDRNHLNVTEAVDSE